MCTYDISLPTETTSGAWSKVLKALIARLALHTKYGNAVYDDAQKHFYTQSACDLAPADAVLCSKVLLKKELGMHFKAINIRAFKVHEPVLVCLGICISFISFALPNLFVAFCCWLR